MRFALREHADETIARQHGDGADFLLAAFRPRLRATLIPSSTNRGPIPDNVSDANLERPPLPLAVSSRANYRERIGLDLIVQCATTPSSQRPIFRSSAGGVKGSSRCSNAGSFFPLPRFPGRDRRSCGFQRLQPERLRALVRPPSKRRSPPGRTRSGAALALEGRGSPGRRACLAPSGFGDSTLRAVAVVEMHLRSAALCCAGRSRSHRPHRAAREWIEHAPTARGTGWRFASPVTLPGESRARPSRRRSLSR